jgi:hypothetical protein
MLLYGTAAFRYYDVTKTIIGSEERWIPTDPGIRNTAAARVQFLAISVIRLRRILRAADHKCSCTSTGVMDGKR